MARTSSWWAASAAQNASSSVFSAAFAAFERPYDLPFQQQDLRDQRLVAERARLGLGGLRRLQHLRPAARVRPRLQRRQPVAQVGHLRARRRILGRAHDRPQQGDVGAAIQRPQRVGRADGVLDDVAVRLGEHVRERAQPAQPFVQARHPQVQHLGRLLLVNVRRLARLLVHVGPALRVARQHAADRRVHVGRVALARLQEGVLDADVPRRLRLAGIPQLPRAGEPGLPAAALCAVIGHALLDAEDQHDRQQRAGDGDRHLPARRRRIFRQRVQQVAHRRKPFAHGRAHAAQEDLADPERDARVHGRVAHLALHHVVGQRVHRVARERPLAVQRLVQRDAEAELIGARVGRRAQELLGRHVRRRSHHRPRARQLHIEHPRRRGVCLRLGGSGGSRQHDGVGDVDVDVGHAAVIRPLGDPVPRSLAVAVVRAFAVALVRAFAVAVPRSLAGAGAARFVAARRLVPGRRLLVHLARQPEVHDAHLVVAPDHDVVGLEIAVHQPLLVRGRQAPPRRHEHLHDVLPAALRRLQPVGDGVPVDELHRDEHLLLKRADVEHDDDVRVRQPGDRLRLAQRPLPSLVARDPGAGLDPQQLDRDLAIQLGVVGRVDLAHPAATDEAEHDVAPDGRAAGERGEALVLRGGLCCHFAFPAVPAARRSRRIGGSARRDPGLTPIGRSGAMFERKPF